MRRIDSVVLMTGLLLSVAARGQDSPRPPWRWTEEERLAKRYDASSMRSRASAADMIGAVSEGRDIVQGDRDPALFLPWEIYRSLIMRAFAPSPKAMEFRDEFQSKSGSARFDNDFWQRLEQTARPYLDSLKAQRALAEEYRDARPGRRAEIDRQADEIGKTDCRLRVQTLETARATFGREAFDRFLYEAVAPSMTLSSLGGDISADHLRYLSGGCQ